jgi:hypothetical protein
LPNSSIGAVFAAFLLETARQCWIAHFRWHSLPRCTIALPPGKYATIQRRLPHADANPLTIALSAINQNP